MSETLEPKDPDTNAEYTLDVRAAVITSIRRDWPYQLGMIGKVPKHTGFYYECTTAGETKAFWPEFSRASGETVDDGSVVWTARHPDDSSLPTISAVTWGVAGDDDELEVASDRIEGGIIYPTLAGGTLGIDYELTAHITWSTGQQDDVTVTIPVRSL